MMKLLMLSLAPALSLAMLAGETVVIPNARCRGFIGIGIMGRGMVHRLLEADVPLVIWNRNLTKAYELRDEWQQIAAQEAGPLAEHLDPAVTVVDTPRQVVEACWRTYLMLSTPEAAASVYEMPDGVLSGVKEGKEIIDCATLRPEDMITNGAAVTQRGGRFLEAPVSGSKGPAEQGTLVFMTGGDEALSREAAEDLAAMGKESVHCGHIGSATRMKLIVNMVMGTQLAAIAEGVALAEGLNVHVGSLQRVLEIGAIGSPMLKVKGPLMASGGAFGAGNPPSNYPANFPLKHAMKDMRFAIGEAKSQLGDQLPGGELPMAGAAHAVFEQASARGYDDADFAAVVEGLRDGYTSASAPQCDHPGTESAAAGGLRRLAQGVHAGGGVHYMLHVNTGCEDSDHTRWSMKDNDYPPVTQHTEGLWCCHEGPPGCSCDIVQYVLAAGKGRDGRAQCLRASDDDGGTAGDSRGSEYATVKASCADIVGVRNGAIRRSLLM